MKQEDKEKYTHPSKANKVKPIQLRVSYDSSCPLYETNDHFELIGMFLTTPPSKKVCLSLVDTIRQKRALLLEHLMSGQGLDFMCRGCSVRKYITVSTVEDSDAGSSNPLTHNLHKFSFFRLIPEAFLEEIYKDLSIDTYKEGEYIIREGSKGIAMYIVVSGEVEVVVGKEDTHIASHGIGAVFGEISLLSGDVCNASIRATKESRILTLTAELVEKLNNRYPVVQKYFYRLLASRLNKIIIQQARHDITEIHGKLSEWHLPDLLQTINMNMKTGRLEFEFESTTSYVEFQNGNICAASYGTLTGLDAFFALFAEQEGVFSFIPDSDEEQAMKPILGDFMSLMMEGLVRADESNL